MCDPDEEQTDLVLVLAQGEVARLGVVVVVLFLSPLDQRIC